MPFSAGLEVLSAVRSLGHRVPEDIGVIAYDNSEPCAFTQNDLTSIDQSGRRLGLQATRQLIQRINGRSEPEHFVVTPRVVVRSSSARPKRSPERPIEHTHRRKRRPVSLSKRYSRDGVEGNADRFAWLGVDTLAEDANKIVPAEAVGNLRLGTRRLNEDVAKAHQ